MDHDSPPRKFAAVSRVETVCMVFGLGGMLLALGVTVAQATLPPVLETEGALRRAVVQSGFDASICPDGWAADHAAMLPLTEAEVTAWYLTEATRLSDAEVIASVGIYVTQIKDFRQIEGPALTRNQILLCIAESRRLVTPLHDRIPPELRAVVSAI
ncbi:hypothetical protein [Jannaschia faecimaris]|nr:hypothetical protein [Jannaschia faecimaris]